MGKTREEARREASQDIHKLNFDGVLSIHEKNTLREMYKKSSDGIDGDSKYMRAWLVELKYVRGWIDNLVADKDIQQRIAQNSIDEHIAQIVEKMNTHISNNRAGSEHIGILQLYLKWNLWTTVPKTRSLMGENRIDGKLGPLTAKAVIAYVTGKYGERESGEVFSKKLLEQSRQTTNYEVTNVSLEGITTARVEYDDEYHVTGVNSTIHIQFGSHVCGLVNGMKLRGGYTQRRFWSEKYHR